MIHFMILFPKYFQNDNFIFIFILGEADVDSNKELSKLLLDLQKFKPNLVRFLLNVYCF